MADSILITGAKGFIASHMRKTIQSTLLNKVVGIDNLSNFSYDADYMDDLRKQREDESPLMHEFHNINMGDFKSDDYFSHVINFASFPREYEVRLNPEAARSTMIDQLRRLFRNVKTKKFVHISSSLVYGDFDNGVKEDAELNPNTEYGRLKKEAEELVIEECHNHCIPYLIIRPSAVYGIGDVNNRLLGTFINNALDGKPLIVKGANEIVDFTHVGDFVRGVRRSIVDPSWAYSPTDNKIINITGGVPYTILEVAEIINSYIPCEIQIEERNKNFPRRGYLCNDEARKRLGYQSRMPLRSGIEQLINHYESLKVNKG